MPRRYDGRPRAPSPRQPLDHVPHQLPRPAPPARRTANVDTALLPRRRGCSGRRSSSVRLVPSRCLHVVSRRSHVCARPGGTDPCGRGEPEPGRSNDCVVAPASIGPAIASCGPFPSRSSPTAPSSSTTSASHGWSSKTERSRSDTAAGHHRRRVRHAATHASSLRRRQSPRCATASIPFWTHRHVLTDRVVQAIDSAAIDPRTPPNCSIASWWRRLP